ncbi:hypothetical protein GQ55_2G049400 [Panicum hallii var. hallii]|uniref:Uncharacterized protein n=1 Tax=Panicum hallii var. hallii TaxID=1504633 RepID=A0A2T7ELJ5_9POAL|nr:hypothetical protein GQ55_2G049400 [Panicum hallii var. hallii]
MNVELNVSNQPLQHHARKQQWCSPTASSGSTRRRLRRRWLWRRPAGRGRGSSVTLTGWCSRTRRRRGGRPGRGAPAGADLLRAPPPRCSVAASPATRSPRSRSGPAPRSSPRLRPPPSCPSPAAAAVLVQHGARVGQAAGQRGETPEGGQPAQELRLLRATAGQAVGRHRGVREKLVELEKQRARDERC